MNKHDFCIEAAAKCGMTLKEMLKVADAFTSTVRETLATGDKVQLIGFGTFEVRHRNARSGKNPATGAAIEIPAADVPVFKAGKAFKEQVQAAHVPVRKRKKAKK